MALCASAALADDTVPPPGVEPIYTIAQIQHPELYQNPALRFWIQNGWEYLGQTGGSDVIEWLHKGRKQRTESSWLIWVVEIKLSGTFAPDSAGQPSYSAERQLWWVNCPGGHLKIPHLWPG